MNDKSRYPASAAPLTSALVRVTPALPAAREATSDGQLIELWLHGRSRHTQRAYRADAERFRAFVGLHLGQVRLADLQAFADRLAGSGMAPASRTRLLASVKSLFSFAHRLGYLPFDTARPLRTPTVRDRLNERILDEAEVQRMLALERQPRNAAILFLLYAAGLRVSELCGLKWRDVQARSDGQGQVTVLGKGSKTRAIVIPSSVKSRLDAIREGSGEEAPVFSSRRRRPISQSQVLRVVKAAARRAGISRNVVAHHFRHCHASHALDRGAPVSLVQATLGHCDLSTTGRYLHARPAESSASYLPL
jgi:integrase/recombinase XerD